MKLATFVKRPINVEMAQFTGSKQSYDEIRKWSGGAVDVFDDTSGRVSVKTAHGPAWCNSGDWIVKGVADFYPITAKVLADTYTEV